MSQTQAVSRKETSARCVSGLEPCSRTLLTNGRSSRHGSTRALARGSSSLRSSLPSQTLLSLAILCRTPAVDRTWSSQSTKTTSMDGSAFYDCSMRFAGSKTFWITRKIAVRTTASIRIISRITEAGKIRPGTWRSHLK